MRWKQNKLFYGSYIVAGAWVVYFVCCVLQSFGCSVLLTKIVTEYHLDDGIIGMCSSVNYVAMAVACGIAGRMIEKKGYRFTILAGCLFGLFAYLIMAFCYTSPVILVSMFVATGIAGGLGALTSSVGIVNAWYHRNKSLPMALLLTSGSVGGFTMPVLSQLISQISLRACFLLYAGMMLLGLVIDAVVLKDKPEDIGEIRDGKRWTSMHPLPFPSGKYIEKPDGHVSLKQCYQSGRFYVLVLQSFLGKGVNAAITSYIILYAIRRGISAMKAALLLTVYNILNLLGRLLAGAVISQTVTRKMVLMVSTALQGAGFLLLFLAVSYPTFLAGAVVTGFGFGMQVTLAPLLISYCFTDDNFASVNSVFNLLGTFGSAAAPMIVYVVAAAFGDYRYAFLTIGISLVICFGLLFTTPMTVLVPDSVDGRNM